MGDEHTLPDGTFTGFQAVDPTVTDWKSRGDTGVSGQIQNPSADWRAYLPVPKKQLMIVDGIAYGDTESCTNFSATNDLATYLQYLCDTHQMPDANLKFLQDNGYFDASGKINLSPRFSAITSGTTGQGGNNLPRVWQTLRTVGIVPDQDCPFPTDLWRAIVKAAPTGDPTLISKLWSAWFDPNAVTPAASAKGLEFLKWFTIQYQWVAYPAAPATPDSLKQDLLVAPLQIATAVCAGWNTDDPIKACGPGTQHATEMTCVEGSVYDILDHYNPFQKQFAIDYNITYAMQGLAVITNGAPVHYPPPPNFNHKFTTQMDIGASGPEVVALQDALKTDGEFPLTVQSTGYFGTVTQKAVGAFQTRYGVVYVGQPGFGRVGPLTMAQLNKLFAQ